MGMSDVDMDSHSKQLFACKLYYDKIIDEVVSKTFNVLCQMSAVDVP
jgi:hypothetical protein